MKSHNYTNFGGMDSKASPYLTGAMEFLSIKNMDFQTPGSLTQRWGSTQYVGQTLASKITALSEFTRLSGASYVLFGNTGGLYVGATTGTCQGLSFIGASIWTVDGASGGLAANGGIYYGDFINSGSGAYNLPGFAGQFLPYLGNYNQRFALGTTIIFNGQTIGSNRMSFVVMNNYLFGCDGNKFFRTDGTTTMFVGAPPLMVQADTTLNGNTFTNLQGASLILMGATGSYLFYGSYVNDRGFEGQIWPISCVGAGQSVPTSSLGGSFIQAQVLAWMPTQYNIASINLYSYWANQTLSMGQTTTWNQPYTFLANIPISGLTLRDGLTVMPIALGTTVGGISALIANIGTFPNTNTNVYYPLGFSAYSGLPGQITSALINNFIPQFCEEYKNQLFLGGFSSAPSFVYFSDVGEPEGYPLQNNFEVRTDNGDYLTCLKSYFTKLYIFKQHSFHVLLGDNINNFLLQEVSNQYGCVNFRCAVIFNDTLLFLDQKGIIQYNGANISILSSKIQATFDSMNYQAALSEATMVHDNIRNQILIGIPINGSTTNNVTVVYDYLVGAWTIQDGYAPSVFASILGRNTTKNAFYGDYSGRVNWFGSSFLADNGNGFTTYFKTRFIHDLGESIQEQYRRLYLDVDPVNTNGTTVGFNINFFQDYGSSIVLSTTFTIGTFQNRIDFGIPAKSLAFELSGLQTTVPLKIHGFTIESRLQRKV